MIKKYMHENLKHTVAKHLTKKIKKYLHFQTVTTKNGKHFFRFHIKQYWQLQGLTTKLYYTLFSVHIKQYPHFQSVTTTQKQTHFQSSYQILVTLWGSYSQTILHTFPDIKQYWHFQRVADKQ